MKTANRGQASALRDLAKGYTEAWCSRDPHRVASFFSPEGSLTVNGSATVEGRHAIAEVVRGFMAAFPDLEVVMDDLLARKGGVLYRWTLTGTDSGPRGTGRWIRMSGFEEWTIGDDGLIGSARGHFDPVEYERQLAEPRPEQSCL